MRWNQPCMHRGMYTGISASLLTDRCVTAGVSVPRCAPDQPLDNERIGHASASTPWRHPRTSSFRPHGAQTRVAVKCVKRHSRSESSDGITSKRVRYRDGAPPRCSIRGRSMLPRNRDIEVQASSAGWSQSFVRRCIQVAAHREKAHRARTAHHQPLPPSQSRRPQSSDAA